MRASHHSQNRSGFSLTEMAFVLIIIGIVVGVTLSTGSVQLDYAKTSSASNQLETIRQALLLYRAKSHTLPCPTAGADAPTAATYGIAAAACDPAACPAGLFCTPTNVVIGTVPFKTIGLNPDAAVDSWDNKIDYIIDYSHTTNGSYGLGRIAVTDAAGNELTGSAIMGKAIFVLVSHGKDGNGGWSKNGTVRIACGGLSLDKENCNNDGTFISSNFNDNSNASYYDDIVLWHSQGGEDTDTYRVSQIKAERYNSCIILANKRLACVGRNTEGQLGLGSTTDQATYREVAGNYADWTQIAFDAQSMCGIRGVKGVLYCWGQNDYGQLGNGASGTDIIVPTPVTPASGTNEGWTMIDIDGTHACGIRSGHMLCWGAAQYGKLGEGSTSGNILVPTEVTGGFSDWTYVGIGISHSCGIRNVSGYTRAYCWGNDANGQLGDDAAASAPKTAPTQVYYAYTDWSQIDANNNYTCGIRNGGELWCWGDNGSGQLGQGDNIPSYIPIQVKNAAGTGFWTDWTSFGTSSATTCGTRPAGLYCWGTEGGYAMLGNGAVTGVQYLPYPTNTPFTDWSSVSVGGTTVCAARKNGNAYCWGRNDFAQVGDSLKVTPVDSPRLVTAY